MGAQEIGKSQAPPVTIRGGQFVFDGFTETDSRVLAEASHWITGSRGAPSPDALLGGADLSPFASQRLRVVGGAA